MRAETKAQQAVRDAQQVRDARTVQQAQVVVQPAQTAQKTVDLTPTLRPGTTVIAAVWNAKPTDLFVGHVYLADVSGNTLTSQFPANGSYQGINITKNWNQTLLAENRPPDAIYRIQVPDAKGLNTQAAKQLVRTGLKAGSN
jgi:hypothetical protein